MKHYLHKFQKIKNKEIYEIDPKIIKNITVKCYKQNVSSKDNIDLYQEIVDLLGLYIYTKNNPDVTPFVIIGKNI
jgi:hypothetical protein